MGDFDGDENTDLLCKISGDENGRTVALSDGASGFKVLTI